MRRKSIRRVDIELTKKRVAAAYARRVADEVSLGLLISLERENSELQATIASRRARGRERSGRHVAGLLLSAFVLSFGMATLYYWYDYTTEGFCFQMGYANGVDGVPRHWHEPAICRRDNSESILSQHQVSAADIRALRSGTRRR
jgi:hypothetical protein